MERQVYIDMEEISRVTWEVSWICTSSQHVGLDDRVEHKSRGSPEINVSAQNSLKLANHRDENENSEQTLGELAGMGEKWTPDVRTCNYGVEILVNCTSPVGTSMTRGVNQERPPSYFVFDVKISEGKAVMKAMIKKERALV